ncbi:MAG: protoporphyrinogen oxidase [Actinomycetota bacterium]
MRRPTVAVIGGGITGLTAAHLLASAPVAPRVVLLEATSRLGGKLRTEAVDGVTVEAGADWFVTTPPWAVDLSRTFELSLVEPAVAGAYIWARGRLRPLPEGFVRGIPTSPLAAVRSGVLSARGAGRALRDLLNVRPLTGADLSVGAFVRRRFGSEVAERLVDPVVAAARAGAIDELSLKDATPDLDDIARSHRSVILGLRALRRRAPQEAPRFLGIEGGMSLLIDGLAARLDAVEVRMGAAVRGLRRSDTGYELRLADDTIAADAVVLAVPAFAAAEIVASLSTHAADELRRIDYADSAVVALTYPPDAGRRLERGSGWLVPTREHKTLTAGAFYSAKWPRAAPADGGLVLRCFVGRGGRVPALDLDDHELISLVAREVAFVTGNSGQPRAAGVFRWDAGLPVYRMGHRERVERIEKELAPLPSLALAGAGYRGSGIPDCIRQGEEAARRVLSSLTHG